MPGNKQDKIKYTNPVILMRKTHLDRSVYKQISIKIYGNVNDQEPI